MLEVQLVENSKVVCGTARALIDAGGARQLNSIELPHSWIQSIYKCMGLVRRMATTLCPPVPKGLYDKCRLQFLPDIEGVVKKFDIPHELVLNSDQTLSSYVLVGRSTMATCEAKTVAIKGYMDKRNITLNFVVALSGEFLPMQMIYGVKLLLAILVE